MESNIQQIGEYLCIIPQSRVTITHLHNVWFIWVAFKITTIQTRPFIYHIQLKSYECIYLNESHHFVTNISDILFFVLFFLFITNTISLAIICGICVNFSLIFIFKFWERNASIWKWKTRRIKRKETFHNLVKAAGWTFVKFYLSNEFWWQPTNFIWSHCALRGWCAFQAMKSSSLNIVNQIRVNSFQFCHFPIFRNIYTNTNWNILPTTFIRWPFTEIPRKSILTPFWWFPRIFFCNNFVFLLLRPFRKKHRCCKRLLMFGFWIILQKQTFIIKFIFSLFSYSLFLVTLILSNYLRPSLSFSFSLFFFFFLLLSLSLSSLLCLVHPHSQFIKNNHHNRNRNRNDISNICVQNTMQFFK